MSGNLVEDLFDALCEIPLIDPHSHIDPRAPVSKSLDDILNYHYYTELAHSAGMPKDLLAPDADPQLRVASIIRYMDKFDNTAQYSWFLEIAQEFLGFSGMKITVADTDKLWNLADRTFAAKTWEDTVFKRTKLEAIFLTNEFDDSLEGFDTRRYIPCLRADTLVFGLHETEVKARLAKVTGIEVGDPATLDEALMKLFENFIRHNAKACAISLPPGFTPSRDAHPMSPEGIFRAIAGKCRDFLIPFDLMIGVNRNVYAQGVHRGHDLFDQRTSLIQYAELFNDFPEVTFPVSVLTSNQNQELASYAWIFPNVVCSGHWWYSNIPIHIARDLRARLQSVPKTKLVGYYSDAYKLEFVLPKYHMYRGILSEILANDYVENGFMSETEAVKLGKYLLRDNVREIFRV